MTEPIEFDLREKEVVVIQFEDGREAEVACVKTTGTQATLRVNPGDQVKRVMKLVAAAKGGAAK